MLLILVVLLSLAQMGRTQADDYESCLTNHAPPPPSLDPRSREFLQRSMWEFSITLFKQIARQQPSENVFISPMSVYNMMLLAYFTSAGHTERSLIQALSLPWNQDKTDTFYAYRTHQFMIKSGKYKSQFYSENRMFISDNQTIKECMADIFYDEIQQVDFSSKGLEEAVKSIIDWISNKTNGQIQNLVPPEKINPDSQIVLANVAYFKGAWKSQFDPTDTKMRKFYIGKNKTALVPMMYQVNRFNHWVSDQIGAELLELPYLGSTEDRGDISFILLLPYESDSEYPANDLLMRLNSAFLMDILKESRIPKNEDWVEVELPKFSMERTLELTSTLESLGVEDLFKPTTNLTRLTGGSKIHLSSVIHKAKMVVDEYGTEAAGTTIFTHAGIPRTSFICDRPFVYLLHDKRENSLLFAGIYNNPSYNNTSDINTVIQILLSFSLKV